MSTTYFCMKNLHICGNSILLQGIWHLICNVFLQRTNTDLVSTEKLWDWTEGKQKLLKDAEERDSKEMCSIWVKTCKKVTTKSQKRTQALHHEFISYNLKYWKNIWEVLPGHPILHEFRNIFFLSSMPYTLQTLSSDK